jgi:hypothetical protein
MASPHILHFTAAITERCQSPVSSLMASASVLTLYTVLLIPLVFARDQQLLTTAQLTFLTLYL